MSNLRRIASSKLFVSEPSPRQFGNEANDSNNISWTNPNWLKSRFHFSFAEWRGGPSNFGVLRVLNDDLVQPKRGFGKHPHSNMEIVTIVVGPGQVSHKDSFSNKSEALGRGSVQFMSAGSGVTHSEHNLGDKPVRFIQSWVIPRSYNGKPIYGSLLETPERTEARHNAFEHIVGDRKDEASKAPVKIDADCNFFLAELEVGKQVSMKIREDRQAYILQIEGRSTVSKSFELEEGDAATAVGSNNLVFDASAPSLILVIEMQKE